MIINVKYGKDVITLDFVLNQIRYCHDIANHGRIQFIDQGQTIMDCYKYLYDSNRNSFLESLAEDMGLEINKYIDPTKLQVITEQEYLEIFK
jgi:hypothetical protein